MNLPNIDPKDVKNVSDAISQVVKNAIGESANVLVPAIAQAMKGIGVSAKVDVSPVVVEVKVTVSLV